MAVGTERGHWDGGLSSPFLQVQRGLPFPPGEAERRVVPGFQSWPRDRAAQFLSLSVSALVC